MNESICRKLLFFNYELRITNYELRITNYELRMQILKDRKIIHSGYLKSSTIGCY